jgi:uncharacterized membrane protein YhhN
MFGGTSWGQVAVWILAGAALFSAIGCIRGKNTGSNLQVYIFKPLTTLLIISVAFIGTLANPSSYGIFVLSAFVFALAGDVFLMLPKDRFIAGLFSFLVAHLLLTGAFLARGVGFTWWLLLLAFLPGVLMYGLLSPYLGRMKVSVLFYVTVISAMVWMASEGVHHLGGHGPALAASGAVLFLCSDATLAWNRFRREFRSAETIVLSTYYMSLFLIALSVPFPPVSG